MFVLPSFLDIHIVSTHVLDKVILTATGRTSPTRLGLISSRASPMPVCVSSSRWCSAGLAVGRATVGGNGALPRRHQWWRARGVKRYELRTVRLGGPDSPQVKLEVVQR